MTGDPAGGRTQGVAPESRRGLVVAVCACAVLPSMLAGCKSGPPGPSKISGSLVASKELNPSVSQRPSPLRLRLYELRTATTFNQADFMALYNTDEAALGADLVAREEFVLQPGETRPYNKTFSPDTRFLGVFAAYRDVERATWRALAPVQAGKSLKLEIRAEALAVAVKLQP